MKTVFVPQPRVCLSVCVCVLIFKPISGVTVATRKSNHDMLIFQQRHRPIKSPNVFCSVASPPDSDLRQSCSPLRLMFFIRQSSSNSGRQHAAVTLTTLKSSVMKTPLSNPEYLSAAPENRAAK